MGSASVLKRHVVAVADEVEELIGSTATLTSAFRGSAPPIAAADGITLRRP
jgi:hypothetical protein